MASSKPPSERFRGPAYSRGARARRGGSVPLLVPWLLRTAAAVSFIWWLVQRRVPARPWSERPLRSGGRA